MSVADSHSASFSSQAAINKDNNNSQTATFLSDLSDISDTDRHHRRSRSRSRSSRIRSVATKPQPDDNNSNSSRVGKSSRREEFRIPKRKRSPSVDKYKRPNKDKGRKRNKFRSFNSDSDTESTSSDSKNDSSLQSSSSSDNFSSDSDYSTSSRVGPRKKSRKNSVDDFDRESNKTETNNKHGGAAYQRFLPVSQKTNTDLAEDLISYSGNFFKEFIKDDELNKSILNDSPVPETIKVESLDEEWQDMLEDGKHSSVKATESALKRVQSRILNIMGPLGKLWTSLEGIRSGHKQKEVDIADFLKLTEQIVCLVGQASVTTAYHRRLNILSRVMKNTKKAQKFLSKNSKHIDRKRKLFGKKFYKKLLKISKDKKRRKSLESLFTTSSRFNSRFTKDASSYNSVNNSYSNSKYQPFRSGPSSTSYRGGGRRGSTRGRMQGSSSTANSTRGRKNSSTQNAQSTEQRN